MARRYSLILVVLSAASSLSAQPDTARQLIRIADDMLHCEWSIGKGRLGLATQHRQCAVIAALDRLIEQCERRKRYSHLPPRYRRMIEDYYRQLPRMKRPPSDRP